MSLRVGRGLVVPWRDYGRQRKSIAVEVCKERRKSSSAAVFAFHGRVCPLPGLPPVVRPMLSSIAAQFWTSLTSAWTAAAGLRLKLPQFKPRMFACDRVRDGRNAFTRCCSWGVSSRTTRGRPLLSTPMQTTGTSVRGHVP